MSRVERQRLQIVNVLLPEEQQSTEGMVVCDLCNKHYAEWFSQDTQKNFCIWCNVSYHEPIGKRNHVRLAIDGRPVFKGSTPEGEEDVPVEEDLGEAHIGGNPKERRASNLDPFEAMDRDIESGVADGYGADVGGDDGENYGEEAEADGDY